MANAIDLAKIYTPMLDEAYKQASLSSDLDVIWTALPITAETKVM